MKKIKMTCIGRQYENLAVLPRIGDAMHVKFRGADEQLQKNPCRRIACGTFADLGNEYFLMLQSE